MTPYAYGHKNNSQLLQNKDPKGTCLLWLNVRESATGPAAAPPLQMCLMILFLKKMNEIYIGTEDDVNNVAHMTCLDIYSICVSSGRHE